MTTFEGILTYSSSSVWKEAGDEEGETKEFTIKLYIKDSWVKYLGKNAKGKTVRETICNPELGLAYDIDYKNELILTHKLEKILLDIKDFPLRDLSEKSLLYGQNTIESDMNGMTQLTRYFIDRFDFGVDYSAPLLRNLKFPNGGFKTLAFFSDKYHDLYQRNGEYNGGFGSNIQFLGAEPMSLSKFIFRINPFRAAKYRILSYEQYRREGDLFSDGIYKSDAIEYLEKTYQRALTDKEKKLCLKLLVDIFDEDSKKRGQLIVAIKEKKRIAEEKRLAFEIRIRNAQISILERELNRELTEEEKIQSADLFIKYLTENRSKFLSLSTEYLNRIKSDE